MRRLKAAGVDVAMPLHTSGLHGHYSDNLYMFSSIGSFEPTSSQYVDESSDYRVCLMSITLVTFWLLLLIQDDDESDNENRWHNHNLSQLYSAV